MHALGWVSTTAAEVGTFCGLSAVIVGMGMRDRGKYYCLDTFEASNAELPKENTLEEWTRNINGFGLQNTCVPIIGDSKSAESSERIPTDLDFVYIDGGHEFEDVLNDALVYGGKVAKAGMILFHDSNWEGPKQAIETLLDMGFMELGRQIDDCGVYTKL